MADQEPIPKPNSPDNSSDGSLPQKTNETDGGVVGELTFKELSGMFKYNPSDQQYAGEITKRQAELNENTDLVNAVRDKLIILFRGEIETSSFQEIEGEILQQFPKFNNPRYQDMIAQTIHAVLREWEFRGQKNVYTPEDERSLSEDEKRELTSILFEQHVKTGITGSHLPPYFQIMPTDSRTAELALVRMAQAQRKVNLDGSVSYELPAKTNQDSGDAGGNKSAESSEFEDNLPNTIKELMDIVRDRNQEAETRKDAGEKIAEIMKKAGQSGLGPRWLGEFHTLLNSFVEGCGGDWKLLHSKLKNLIDLFDGKQTVPVDSVFEDTVKQYRDWLERLQKDKYSRYEGMVEAMLIGCLEYARNKYFLEAEASSEMKYHYENICRDIMEFWIFLPGLKTMMENFKKKEKDQSSSPSEAKAAEQRQRGNYPAGDERETHPGSEKRESINNDDMDTQYRKVFGFLLNILDSFDVFPRSANELNNLTTNETYVRMQAYLALEGTCESVKILADSALRIQDSSILLAAAKMQFGASPGIDPLQSVVAAYNNEMYIEKYLFRPDDAVNFYNEQRLMVPRALELLKQAHTQGFGGFGRINVKNKGETDRGFEERRKLIRGKILQELLGQQADDNEMK
ncbi:MAG: hypothetical protein NZM26_04610, partial [Patescibacteria group bacterium]|nr:hypothetical protein [Patescibacteria group bacterium]